MSDIVTDLQSLRVLPCVDAQASFRPPPLPLEWLVACQPDTLAYRAAQDDPDLLLAVADSLAAPAWNCTLARRALAFTPTLLLATAPAAIMRAAQRLGIHSVLPRSADPDRLAAALLATHAGLAVQVPRLAPRRNSELSSDAYEEALTPRELEVLELVAAGRHNREIAAALHVSEHTVKFHVSSLLAKLASRSRAEAVRTAIARGLVTI